VSKKHFEALAYALSAEQPAKYEENGGVSLAYLKWENCVGIIANVLAASNPRFDRAKFLEACGI